MSIRLMTIAWESELPTGPKMVLLALCDNANDQGNCYPSVSTLTLKCSMSERSVFNHLKDLEHIGAVTRIERPGRSTLYQLDPCKFCTPANFAPLQPMQPPLQPLHPTPATVAPITTKEPTHSVRKKSEKAQDIERPDSVSPEVWAAYLTVRKGKGAKTMSAIAWQGLVREAAAAGLTHEEAVRMCVERNWQSLRADWLQPKTAAAGPARNKHAAAAAAIFEDAIHV